MEGEKRSYPFLSAIRDSDTGRAL